MKTKSRKKAVVGSILLLLAIVFAGFVYWSLHSQRGFLFTWGRFAQLVPGRLEWQRLDLNLTHRTVEIEDLSYTHPSGVKVVTVKHLSLQFKWSSIFRLRAMLQKLNADDITVDLGSLPPGKKPGSLSNVIREITRRLAVEESRFTNIRIQLKNGYLHLPDGQFSFWPALIGKDEIRFSFSGFEGVIAEKPVKLDLIQYEGSFADPEMVRKIFIFRQASGTLTLKGLEYGPLKLADLTTQASFDGSVIDFKEIRVGVGSNVYLLTLQFSPFDKAYKGKLSSAEPLNPDDIPGLTARLKRAYQNISFSADFDLAGFVFKEMEGEFSLSVKATGNRINAKVPTLNLNAAAKVKDGRFEISRFEYTTERTKMSGKGFVDAAQEKLDVNLSGTGLDLWTFISFFSDIEIHGYVDFAGTIQGALRNPDFRFQGKALESGYKFLRFGENSGTFEILGGDMRYSGRSPPGASYSATIEVRTFSLFDGKKRRTTLKSSFNNLNVSDLLENPGMQGKIDGTWDMEVAQGKKNGTLNATIKDYRLYQFRIGDMEIQGKLVDNTFSFPLLTFLPPRMEKLKTPSETVFKFDDAGFTFKGSPIVGMNVEGKMLYSRKNVVDLKAVCKSCSTAPLLATLEYPPYEGSLDGTITMEMIIGNFDASTMNAEVTRLELPLKEGVLTNSGNQKIRFAQGAYQLDRVALTYNGRTAELKGTYATEKPLNLTLTGEIDLGILREFPEYVRDGEGPAKLDLKITGTRKQPTVRGSVEFEGALLTLRALPNAIEEIRGKLQIDEQKITTDNLTGSISEGDLSIRGTVWHEAFRIKKADLKAEVREIAYSEPGTFKLFLSGKLALLGEAPNMTLSGDLDITEGLYYRNFEIRDFFLKPAPAAALLEKGGGFDNIQLDLRVRSTGELKVKNNVAELFLRADLAIWGTKAKPTYTGILEVLEGEFHYFKLNFDNAKGIIDLRNVSQGHPYVEFTAQRLFDRPTEQIEVILKVEGYTNNLEISFNSNPPLEKRDIIGLIFTGAMPGERSQISGASIASSVLASQLTSILEGPVSGVTGLDIFKLEASDPESKSLTSLVVGKRLTERLALEFKTDLDLSESIKAIQAEYILFDNILLKGSRTTNNRYRLELTFRFKGF